MPAVAAASSSAGGAARRHHAEGHSVPHPARGEVARQRGDIDRVPIGPRGFDQ
jgi:hypothetical protein